jgi:hypothetical protein
MVARSAVIAVWGRTGSARWILGLFLLVCLPHGAGGQTEVRDGVTDRPRVGGRSREAEVDANSWFIRNVARDLGSLAKVSHELVRFLEVARPSDVRAATKRAGKVAKLARNLWSNIQHRRSARPKPPSAARGPARPPAESLGDARAIGRLVAEVSAAVDAEARDRRVDVRRRAQILDSLERINRLALHIARPVDH